MWFALSFWNTGTRFVMSYEMRKLPTYMELAPTAMLLWAELLVRLD